MTERLQLYLGEMLLTEQVVCVLFASALIGLLGYQVLTWLPNILRGAMRGMYLLFGVIAFVMMLFVQP